MDSTAKRDFMITNKSLNTMLKPNGVNGRFTISSGTNYDFGIKVIDGKLNHHMAIVFDIVYDHMYRLFNQMDGSNFIISSLTQLLSKNNVLRTEYFKTFLSNTKLEFYNEVLQLLQYSTEVDSIPFDPDIRDDLLNKAPDIINNAFPLNFKIPFKKFLRDDCEIEGNLDRAIDLLKNYNFERSFFLYLLEKMFYGKLPSLEGFNLSINLEDIFENDERSVYILKKWFKNIQHLKLSLIYPITCFRDFPNSDQHIPRKLFLQNYMFALPEINPIGKVDFKKSKMTASISLSNKFMVFFAHDAKLCNRTYVPSSLYKLGSNSFFIGKNLLNNYYYNKNKKLYVHRLNYTM